MGVARVADDGSVSSEHGCALERHPRSLSLLPRAVEPLPVHLSRLSEGMRVRMQSLVSTKTRGRGSPYTARTAC